MFKGAVMSSFSNGGFQLWTIGLCVALMLVAFSAVAIFIFMWGNQPYKEDPHRRDAVEKRLSELAEVTRQRQARSA